MALYYRIDDIRGGSDKPMSLIRAKAVVARELNIKPLYVSIDPDGEYIRVEFAQPRPRKHARPARRRKSRRSSVKLIGIEFQPR
jgi:hypothetical protein